MSGTLIVWKAPVVDDEDAATRLLAGYYATGDETAFEPSPDVGSFHDELLDRYPPLEDIEGEAAATWASTPERSDRVVSIDSSGLALPPGNPGRAASPRRCGRRHDRAAAAGGGCGW